MSNNHQSRSSRPVVTVLTGQYPPPDLTDVRPTSEILYTDDHRLAEDLRGADVLFVWDSDSRAVPAALGSADRLRWLHVAAAGVDTVLCDELRQSNIVLTNSSGVFDGAVAEYVLGSILLIAKDFPGTLQAQAKRRWHHRQAARVAGAKAVIVGTGPIGRAIARLLKAVGMSVLGIGRTARLGDPDFGMVHTGLAEHVTDADYVIAAAPLTEATAGMFDARVFSAMKPTAHFVNVGRGRLAITNDLIDALENGVIAGAVIDVFETEPLPAESPLWRMPNVLVSPHMSAACHGSLSALSQLFANNFRRWQLGLELHNVVDKKLGYVPTPRHV